MCYDSKAQPPVPPGAGGRANGEDITLTAADGTQFLAYVARPEVPKGAQILIYPDVRGLHNFYKELALRFAEVGYPALVLDFFGRTAGLSERDDKFEFMPHVQQLHFDTFRQDVEAALSYMRQNLHGNAPVFVVGFCMGGSLTLLTGTNPDFGFAGLIAFYSGTSRSFAGKGSVLENVADVKYPVLGLYGGDDKGIPLEHVREIGEKLHTAGVENLIVVYDGAPHSFFDRRYEEYAEASADSWRQMLAFIEEHS
jgi:carboxymethylenebutenolidase